MKFLREKIIEHYDDITDFFGRWARKENSNPVQDLTREQLACIVAAAARRYKGHHKIVEEVDKRIYFFLSDSVFIRVLRCLKGYLPYWVEYPWIDKLHDCTKHFGAFATESINNAQELVDFLNHLVLYPEGFVAEGWPDYTAFTQALVEQRLPHQSPIATHAYFWDIIGTLSDISIGRNDRFTWIEQILNNKETYSALIDIVVKDGPGVGTITKNPEDDPNEYFESQGRRVTIPKPRILASKRYNGQYTLKESDKPARKYPDQIVKFEKYVADGTLPHLPPEAPRPPPKAAAVPMDESGPVH